VGRVGEFFRRHERGADVEHGALPVHHEIAETVRQRYQLGGVNGFHQAAELAQSLQQFFVLFRQQANSPV